MLDKPARSTTRDDLRSAVHKRSGAAKAVSQAEKALSAATTTLKQAQQRLAKYHGIDALLNEHRDAISKAWATGGSDTREYVPPDVIEKVRERDAAADDVAAAQRAVELITNDLAQCRAVLHKWERRANLEAAKILAEHTKQIAAELREAQQRVWDLSSAIRGVARCWTANAIDPDGALAPIQLGREVLNSLDRPEPAYAPANNPETLSAARYRAWHLGLQTNPDLKLEEAADETSNPKAVA